MEEKIICENGVPLYSYKNNKINTFAISLYVRYGVLHESEDMNGFAHFFEHAVFRNISFLMNGELYKTLDANALEFNGSTFSDYIEFRIYGSHKRIENAIKIFSMLFEPISLPTSELETEKKRIKAEIREECSENLDTFAYRIIWSGTPIARTIPGKCKNISSYGIKKLKKMRDVILSPENIFIYAGGNISDTDLKSLKKEVSKYILSPSEKRSGNVPTPTDFCKRNCKIALRKSQSSSVILNFDIPQDGFTISEINCLGDLLFSGESSPFHMELSENRGLIYAFDDNSVTYPNISVITVKYDVRSDNLMKSLELVLEFFANAEQTVKERFHLIQPFYTDYPDRDMDDAASIASTFGYNNHILEQNFLSIDERKKAFLSLKSERLCELSRRIFRTDNLVIAINGNKEKVDTEIICRMAKTLLKI